MTSYDLLQEMTLYHLKVSHPTFHFMDGEAKFREVKKLLLSDITNDKAKI